MTAADILDLSQSGMSNRAISANFGIPRATVRKTLATAGQCSPFSTPSGQKRTEPAITPGRQYEPGEVLTEWLKGDVGTKVRLRAVVIRQYRWHVHCAIQARRRDGWERVYDGCF